MSFSHHSGRRAVSVSEALEGRKSTRQFLDKPLSEGLVREILDVARWAPSGGNLQPWRVIAVSGAERDAVIRIGKPFSDPSTQAPGDRPVYPASLWEPYRARRFKLGEDMYALLGIPRGDRSARLARWAQNYEFFGAPVGLFFVIDERMGHAQWAHLGMLIHSIALVAHERGLGSCMQEAWAAARQPLKAHFGLDSEEMIYCGMALGWPDTAATINSLRADRMGVEELASFRGFSS